MLFSKRNVNKTACLTCLFPSLPVTMKGMDTISQIRKALTGADHKDPKMLAPLVLAYIGDTVYDLYVRTKLILELDTTPHKLHLAAAGYVCAAGQAKAFRRVEALLTEEEQGAYRRGRNAHSGTVPKNAAVSDYRMATGFEALIGYLFLSGRDDRITELMKIAMEDEA